MSNMDKMRMTNFKIRKYLTTLKFKNITFFPHTRFSKDLIIDDLGFDGICTSLGNKIVLFQAKTNTKPTKKLMIKYREFSQKYNVMCFYIVRINRKGVFIFQ